MSQVKEERFTIMWRIKNFSMCSKELCKWIETPVFRVRKFGNSEWSIKLYPGGYHLRRGYLSCFLRCRSLGNYEDFKMILTLSIIGQSSVFKKYSSSIELDGPDEFGSDDWFRLKDILKEKDKYLPNDTLTLKCVLKCTNPKNSIKTVKEIIETFSRESVIGKDSLILNKCCIETVIHVQTKSVFWPIRKFQSLSIGKRLTLPVYSATKEIPSLYVTLFKSTESLTCIGIRRKEGDGITQSIFVRCSVCVANASENVDCRACAFSFKTNFIYFWKIPIFLNDGELEDRYFKHTMGDLYLQFVFAFSSEGNLHHSERTDWEPVCLPPKRQVQLDVLTRPTADDEEPSVVSLRSNDQSFKVHKSILEASSKVLSDMFEIDMKEKATGVADIRGVDAQTLGLMVAFLYSGTVGDISVVNCTKLYTAAHKYMIMSLIEHCSSILISSMTKDNVCGILCLAELYNNDLLKKCAEAFIIGNSNPDEILMSPKWKIFMENDPQLAAGVMYKMLIK